MNKNKNNATKAVAAMPAAKTRNKVLGFLKTHRRLIFYCVYFSVICCTPVFASEKWQQVTGQVGDWIQKLGGVVCGLGGIMFALGFKNDDADQKTRGLQTMVAGGLTAALSSIIA